PFSSKPIGFEGSTTTLHSSTRACCGISSLIVSSHRARTTASAPVMASSTEAARARVPSSSASAFGRASSLEANTTDSPPATRCRARARPMLPAPMIAVVIATPFWVALNEYSDRAIICGAVATQRRSAMADSGDRGGIAGISLGGIIVIVGIILIFVWSFLGGLIVVLVGLIAFGGF